MCSTPGGVVGGGTRPSAAAPRDRRCAQRRVASWGVAHDYGVYRGRDIMCSTPGGVVGGGTTATAGPETRRGRAQRRVASWGVAPDVEGDGGRPQQLCSTPGGVVGGGTPGSPRGCRWAACAQRRVASWGVARDENGGVGVGEVVLNAGWRRGGWHAEGHECAVTRRVCSTPGGVVGGGTPAPALENPAASRAQRRVASWGVAPDRDVIRATIQRCSTPGGVVGGGTSSSLGWLMTGVGCSTPGGVVGGGTFSFCSRPRRMCSAQRRVASWGVAHRPPRGARRGPRVLNAGWRRGGWHPWTVRTCGTTSMCSTPGGVVGGGTRGLW